MEIIYKLNIDNLIKHLKEGNKFRYKFSCDREIHEGTVSEFLEENELEYHPHYGVITLSYLGRAGDSTGRFHVDSKENSPRDILRLKHIIETDLAKGYDFEFSVYEDIIE